MGKLTEGILGPISGKAGSTVSYVLNGQNVIRSLSNKVIHLSAKQLANCQRMAVTNAFLRHIQTFLKMGFGPTAFGTTKNFHNLAVSYNKKNALTGSYPNITMDYAKARVSEGIALEAQNPTVERVAEGLKFSWENDPHLSVPEAIDQVMMMAYFPDEQTATFEVSGAKRMAGHDTLFIHPSRRNKPMETYISFISNDRITVANSTYLGRITPED